LGAERYTCRNMFGFGYSQNLVSELNLFAEILNISDSGNVTTLDDH